MREKTAQWRYSADLLGDKFQRTTALDKLLDM